MERSEEDLVEALRYVFGRLDDRLVGLTDAEWAWCPVVGDDRIGIRWRLDHVQELLAEPRCRAWLGDDPTGAVPVAPATGADDARCRIRVAFADFVDVVERADLTREVGAVGGVFASSTRRAFVLHVFDELVHHGAETTLLRDLHAGRPLD